MINAKLFERIVIHLRGSITFIVHYTHINTKQFDLSLHIPSRVYVFFHMSPTNSFTVDIQIWINSYIKTVFKDFFDSHFYISQSSKWYIINVLCMQQMNKKVRISILAPFDVIRSKIKNINYRDMSLLINIEIWLPPYAPFHGRSS